MYNYITSIIPLSLYHVSSSQFLVLSHNTLRLVEGKKIAKDTAVDSKTVMTQYTTS